MRNKHDINRYIRYEQLYRRKKSAGRKYGKAILIVLIAICFGLGAYYFVKYMPGINPVDDNESEDYTPPPKQIASYSEDAGDINVNTDSSSIKEQPDNNGNTPTSQVTGRPEVVDTRKPVKAKGIYITSNSAGSNKINNLIKLADTTEINTVVIDIKDDQGMISYRMDYPYAKEIGSITDNIPDMKTLVKILKDKGIYMIARIVAFKDPYLAEQNHELAIKKKDGNLYRDSNKEYWVNPYKKEVWDYLLEIADQAVKIGFDEIQFDYIRFATGQEMNEAYFGEESRTKSKEDIILEFTKYMYEKLKPLGVFVSADVYGTIISSKIDAGLVGQNYVTMARYLDYICPMIYPSHFGEGNYGIDHPDMEPYEIVRKVLAASKEKLDTIPKGEHCAIVRPWLQDFTATWLETYQEYGATQLREQLKGLYEVGYDEWLLWNSSCKYSKGGLVKE